MTMGLRWVGIAIVLGMWSAPALAEWGGPRANGTGTGAVAGDADLTDAVPHWRYYLGGSIAPRGAFLADVNGDDKLDIVYVSHGSLVAKQVDDSSVWSTPVLGVTQIVGRTDLDGDGTTEFVVHSQRQVYVIRATTGEVAWELPLEEIGTIGGVRFGDLDGDGKDDIFVQDCGCCRVNNGTTGFAYSFASGLAAPTKLWTLPSVRCGAYKSMSILDANGDGANEVTLATSSTVSLLNGATGDVLVTSPDLGERAAEGQCIPANVDGEPGEELVCALSSNMVAAGTGHRLFVLRWSEDDATFNVMWEQNVGDRDASLSVPGGFVSDVDGDGALEIAIVGQLADGDSVSILYDARTGAELARLVGERFAGMSSTGGGVIASMRDATLTTWSFRRDGNVGALTQRWTVDQRFSLSSVSWDVARRAFPASSLMVVEPSEGAAEVVTGPFTTGGRLAGYLVAADTATVTRSHPLGEAEGLLSAWAMDGRTMIATSGGLLHVLDDEFEPTSHGVRFGGYYAKGDWRRLNLAPITASFGDGADAIIVNDSTGALLRIDARDRTLFSPSVPEWRVSGATGPVVLPRPGGPPAIACTRRDDDGSALVATLDASGDELWRKPVEGTILSSLVAANLNVNDDSQPDLIVEWGESTDSFMRHRALSGVDGSLLWDAPPHEAPTGTARFPAGSTVADWNGDGVDDYVYTFNGVHVISGVDGAMLATTGDQSLFYFLPTIHDVDADGQLELTLHGGFNPARTLDTDLTEIWTSEEHDRPYPYGAIAACEDQPLLLVEGSLLNASTLKMTQLSGATAGAFDSLVLAGGQAFASIEEASSAGVRQGELTTTSIHSNGNVEGGPLAFVGSSDGWLYAVNPCTATIEYARNFNASVGAVSFGDTDGDGKHEAVVSVADGFLYGLKRPAVLSPAFVHDLDPKEAMGTDDVDEVDEDNRLAATWAAVDGAEGYEVAVVRGIDYAIVSPWRNVGDVTRVTLDDLTLADGERYLFLVRAIEGDRTSPDEGSDGVTVSLTEVVDPPTMPGEPAAGCCRSSEGRGVPWLFGLVLLVAVGRRRCRSM